MSSFKVGDRVAPKQPDELGLFDHWMEYWAEDGDKRPEAFYVTGIIDVRERNIVYSAHPGGAGPQCPERYFSPAPTLRIETGRYYKTRDGRKVGPAERFMYQSIYEDSQGRTAAFYIPNQGSYTADGIWLVGYDDCRHDIVAEWVDEPAEDLSEAFDEIDELLKEFEEPSNDNEPTDNLVFTISTDTSALDAEIDRVMKRLKKLRKKARKAGIALTFSSLQAA